MDGWTERTITHRDGSQTRCRERPSPRQAGAVEQWFYEYEQSEYGTRDSGGPARITETRAKQRDMSHSSARLHTSRRVELTAKARDAIRRELDERWDGREHGGALAGYVDGGRIVITDANGLGVGVETERGGGWIKAPVSRFHDFAVSRGLALVGEWHTHPPGSKTLASTVDRNAWENVRAALKAPAYVGLILMPRSVVSLGLTAAQDEQRWSWDPPEFGAYLVTADGCHDINLDLT